MIRTTPWPAGTPCWADLSVPDVDAAARFYGALFGWDVIDQGVEFGHYCLAKLGDHDAAGIGPIMEEGQPSVWTLYFAADDAAATAARIAANGGTMMFDPMPIPGDGSFGTMAVALDPTGAAFGVWQAADHLGSAAVNEPGGLTWEDLRSPNPAAARSFYESVFAFTYEDIEGLPDGMEYQTFHNGGEPLGGVGDMMGQPGPPHWAVYFGVLDADAAVVTAAANGGSVLSPAFDSPYGRMACLADPAGAAFWVVQVPPRA